jgi:hypothetical protein
LAEQRNGRLLRPIGDGQHALSLCGIFGERKALIRSMGEAGEAQRIAGREARNRQRHTGGRGDRKVGNTENSVACTGTARLHERSGPGYPEPLKVLALQKEETKMHGIYRVTTLRDQAVIITRYIIIT